MIKNQFRQKFYGYQQENKDKILITDQNNMMSPCYILCINIIKLKILKEIIPPFKNCYSPINKNRKYILHSQNNSRIFTTFPSRVGFSHSYNVFFKVPSLNVK